MITKQIKVTSINHYNQTNRTHIDATDKLPVHKDSGYFKFITFSIPFIIGFD